jgi:hypothetical protein
MIYIHSPSYLGGRVQEDGGSKQLQANSLQDLYIKKTKQNKTKQKNPSQKSQSGKKKKIHTKIGKLPFDSDFMDYIFVLWC